MDPFNFNLEEVTKDLVAELGLQDEPEETQVYLLQKLGRNIFVRISVAVKTIVPEEKHAELDQLLEANDLAGFQALVKPHIPDFPAFVQAEATKELENVKRLIAEEREAETSSE